MPPSTPDGGRRRRLAAIAVAALLGVAWGGPIVGRMIGDVDYPFHLKTAEDFAATGRITMPHFLLQTVLGAMLATRLFASLEQAGIVFFTAMYALSAGLICWYVTRGSGPDGPPLRSGHRGVRSAAGLVLGVAAAIGVLMAAPILPRDNEDLFLIGYFPPNVYHNPTMLVAKPLLVLTLASAVAAVTRTGRPRGIELAWLAAPVLLLGVAKPNYLACLVPALAAVWIWTVLSGRRGTSWLRVATVAMAAVISLALTLILFRFFEVGAGATFEFAPLRVISQYTDVDAKAIVNALVVSLGFPLAVTVLWPRATWGDPAMRFAWVAAAIGLFISYTFAEEGRRLADGNFLWTGQMAVFVLFVAAAALVVTQVVSSFSPSAAVPPRLRTPFAVARGLAAAAVLSLHVASGLRHVQIKVVPSQWLTFWT